ncbi:MAG: indolepyruvate ferredoxin oxidoreductase family protein [Proteobacteria bacterium]|nr:indolepyruvate ferredoxin oxidoreductase family protein [Pseudomonadota bacterium]HQR02495.1 indolepyruvate ferredoxin oxidoreductase family protein [Rhodocyclaceae bacterium]
MSPLVATPRQTTLEERYTLPSGRVYLNGYQTLVRLLLLQQERDRAAGLNTAGFVSGYRGSPLGGLDQTLWGARSQLDSHAIRFQPGINEDMAATAVWGSQQVGLFPGARYDGVFALWYGKGPGVDRCGDVFRHANAAGSARHGGVLVVAGDDHGAKSSTLPHQTDHVFKAVLMPILAPAGLQEYLDLGLHGWALSRYSGCWVAFKAVADTVETSASVSIDPERVNIVLPTDFEMPMEGLNIRWPDPPLAQEQRLLHHKLYAALAYCRANRLNRVVMDSPRPRLGILTSGKSYLDVRQALDDLGIDVALAAQVGLRVYKAGMIWPLEAEGVRRFAEGLEEILVVEEKRQFLEYQLKEELYNWREDVRPRIIGKFDEKGEWSLLPTHDGRVDHGQWLLPAAGELTPALIARVIAGRIGRYFTSPAMRDRLAFLDTKEKALAVRAPMPDRLPVFCPGCPHNTSTRVPDGSRATAGIGCHYMATWLPGRSTATFSHMGGEGVAWVGQAPFTETRHVFANLGDGTYFHSGILAIRQAVAAGMTMTYKLLYNDAVAMTGGQPLDGKLSVPVLARQLIAEGIAGLVVVTDGTPRSYAADDLPAGTPLRHRDTLDQIQRELRETPGVTVLIYDQTCAAEKRRRRKRQRYSDPPLRMFINERVCEDCGDCSEQSNCMAVVPVDTAFGRKRAIDQWACNKDYTCLKGFCPSFVSVEGGRLRRGRAIEAEEGGWPVLPVPAIPELNGPYGILVTGVGGTGVVTIGALVGMAAHLDGLGVTVLDMTGLAQKGGAVFSHVRLAPQPDQLHASRIAHGEADVLIGGDLVVSAGIEALTKVRVGHTQAVVNRAETPTLEFIHDPDCGFPRASMESAITDAVGPDRVRFVDATALTTALAGDEIATNIFLLGMSWQMGLIPVSAESLDQALALNATALDLNRRAFLWGRRAACDPAAVQHRAWPADPVPLQPVTVETEIARFALELEAYRDADYAQRYRHRMARIAQWERPTGATRLLEAVAGNYFKLLAYKDEYEVARLFSGTDFRSRLDAVFEGDYRIAYHFAIPLLGGKPDREGRFRKRRYGAWMGRVLTVLARLKCLRGTRWDVFGYSRERRQERQWIADYEADLEQIIAARPEDVIEIAIELARLPERLRGYGAIKARAGESMARQRAELLQRLSEASIAAPPAQQRLRAVG